MISRERVYNRTGSEAVNVKMSPVWSLGKQPLAFNVEAGRWRGPVVAAVTLEVDACVFSLDILVRISRQNEGRVCIFTHQGQSEGQHTSRLDNNNPGSTAAPME